MKILSLIFIFLLLLSLIDESLARGGGGRGGRGRGRGRSGARGGGGGAGGRSGMRSGLRGSSSYSNGGRTGAYGYKVQSKSPRLMDFGSKSFRGTHFHAHNQLLRGSPGHPFVILFATKPLMYDERNYYWNYGLAKENHGNITHPGVVCEYVFGEDDGELQNVTFLNGTKVTSIFFGCLGQVACCGMYCCHDFDQWFELCFVLGFIALMIFVAYHAKKSDANRPLLNGMQPKKKKEKSPVKPSEMTIGPQKSKEPIIPLIRKYH